MCRKRSNRTDEWRPFLARNAKGGDIESQEDQTGDKRRGVKETRRNKRRETGNVSRNRVRFARVPHFSWSAHTWPRNACSQKTRGTAIVLSAVAVKSARGSLHDRTQCPPIPTPNPIDSAFLSRALVGRFRRVILLFRPYDGSSRFFAASSKMIIVREWRRDDAVDIAIILIKIKCMIFLQVELRINFNFFFNRWNLAIFSRFENIYKNRKYL